MDKKIKLRIITPDKKEYNKDIDYILLRAIDGEIVIMADHTPITLGLDYGIVKIVENGEDIKFSIMGGFAEVLNNCVTIVSDAFEFPEDIDIERVNYSKEKAEKIIFEKNNDRDIRKAEMSLRKALIRKELVSYKLKK